MTYLDLADPACDVTSPAVHAAREEGWWVETSYGWAVLRYAEASALLRDRRFRQGNARWPEQNGLHSGPFVGWWKETLLSLEGDDHARLRRLLSPAFRKQAIEAMVPRFQRLADELVDGFADRGRVEFIGEFAEPYAARIICVLLGLPEDNWRQVAHWADDLGKSFGVRIADDLPRIEAALEGLRGLHRRGGRGPPGAPARRPGVDPGPGRGERGPAERSRARGRAGVPRLRRHGDHPQPARAWRCRRCWPVPTSGGCSASGPSSAGPRSRR